MSKNIVVWVTSPKGGIGKSTLAWHLAVMWVQKGLKVAILDSDVNHVCSLANIERRYKKRHIRADLQDLDVYKLLPGLYSKYIQVLKRNHDITIIDSGIRSEQSMQRNLEFADFVFLPVSPSRLDVQTTIDFWPKLQEAIQLSRRTIPVHMIINEVADMRDDAELIIKRLMDLSGASIFKQIIHRRAIFERTLIDGLSINEVQTLYDDKKAVDEMSQLFAEVNQLVNLGRRNL